MKRASPRACSHCLPACAHDVSKHPKKIYKSVPQQCVDVAEKRRKKKPHEFKLCEYFSSSSTPQNSAALDASSVCAKKILQAPNAKTSPYLIVGRPSYHFYIHGSEHTISLLLFVSCFIFFLLDTFFFLLLFRTRSGLIRMSRSRFHVNTLEVGERRECDADSV